MQLEALECGAACLAMIMAFYRKWVPLEQVRVDCGVSRDGSNMKNISIAARNYGFEANGYKMSVEAVREKGTFPCIIHWDFNHFVVLDGFKKNKAVINDPARGRIEVSMDEFDRSFTGVCLIITPGEGFVPSGKRENDLSYLLRHLKGIGGLFAFVIITSALICILGIIDPVMNRVFYDKLLSGAAASWLRPFMILTAVLCFVRIVTETVRTVYSLKIKGKLAIESNAAFMWKILRLPMDFFSQRLNADLMVRQSDNALIASALTESIIQFVLYGLMVVFYSGIIFSLSPVLALAGLLSLLINLLSFKFISEQKNNMARLKLRDSTKLYSATMTGISMNESIKAAGAEKGFFDKWAGYQASVYGEHVKMFEFDAVFGVIPQIVNMLTSYIVLVFGVYLTINGRFTLGIIVMIQQFLLILMQPVMTHTDPGRSLSELRTRSEKIEDILDYPADPYVRSGDILNDYSKLTGKVSIRNLTFGYSKLGNPVVTDFNMELEPGRSVAIVGESGSGKSTIGKLITGLYEPWEGEILFDSKNIKDIPREIFTGSVAMVDQNIVLFEDTLADNIRLWDRSIEDFEVILAARDAGLHDEILMRPGGYHLKLSENGRDLSGGQRQRLEIARVLAQDPSVIILDEATSSLDAETEYEVMRSIKARGISCIIIAHRLSTVRECDEIIVLDKGVVAERGTHETLYKKGGIYTELVTND
ncbi:MAG: ATP-binding cassette domain-containing protein [Lachnospiraceae bacterium]|nr:ATP-binding cassette domain-containing protein [Lachnospiraceae bacterium]